MLQILRELTPEEKRQVELECGARPASSPEEIIRSLSRMCGATVWGLFPAGTDDVLLDHAGQKLGMPPLIRGPRAVSLRERAILSVFLRQAWQAADPERQRRVLEAALEEWDNPHLPRPDTLHDGSPDQLYITLEALLQQPSGCRALALATLRVPLELPYAPPPGPSVPWMGVPPGMRGPLAQKALYSVLLILWRARARLLRERRGQRAQLERQLRQLQSLLEVRHRDLSATPVEWRLNPLSGLSVAGAAATSLGIHAAIEMAGMAAVTAPAAVVPAMLVGAAGLGWTVIAAATRPRASSDRRISRLSTQIHHFRNQFARLDREIFSLETE